MRKLAPTGLTYLTPRQLLVLRMRREGHTYDQIAEPLNVTRERAKNIHDQAVDKLIVRELEENPA